MRNSYFHVLLSSAFGFGQTKVNILDTNLLKCIKLKYLRVLNPSNRLVTLQAANLKRSLACTHGQIHNMDGLKYFTGLTSIDLNTNQLFTNFSDLINYSIQSRQ